MRNVYTTIKAPKKSRRRLSPEERRELMLRLRAGAVVQVLAVECGASGNGTAATRVGGCCPQRTLPATT